MRRGSLFASLLALVIAVGCGGNDDDDNSSAAKPPADANAATVAITTTVDKRRFHGSGFLLGGRAQHLGPLPKGFVITSTSSIWDRDSIEVQLEDGSTEEAELMARSPCDDVSVLLLAKAPTGVPILSLAKRKSAHAGDTVRAIGYPEAIRSAMKANLASSSGTLSAGYVPAELQELLPTFPSLMHHQVELEPGMAGGPLVDRTGRVIGMNTQIDEAGPNASGSYAVSSTYIQQMLDELTHGEREGNLFGGWSARHRCHHPFSDVIHEQRGYTPMGRSSRHDEDEHGSSKGDGDEMSGGDHEDGGHSDQ